MAKPENTLPTWAPRLRKDRIRRLYETDARGIYDEELIDEVGCALMARCESFVDAVAACRGLARCPCCGTRVPHSRRKEDVLHCECGWTLPWGEYFKTIQHKQLSGAEPVLEQFGEFVLAFPVARSPRDKMVLIDRLIHGFHWMLKTEPTRPVAVNLIQGRLNDVVEFLDTLSRGTSHTPGLADRYAQWNRHINVHPHWFRSRRGDADQVDR